MSASATQATPPDDPGPPAADAHALDTYLYRQALHDFIAMGTGIAHHLHAQADAQAAQQASAPAPQAKDTQPAPAPHLAPAPAQDALIKTAASFDQIARAVRRCIAQAQSLDAPKHQQPASHPAPDRTTARKRIIRAVEDVIQRPPDNPECDEPEILLADLRERMDTPDLEDDVASRPAEDIIKDILRDLGLAALPGSRPWKRRTPADIAELNARAAAASTPGQPGAEPQGRNPSATQPAPGPQHDSGESTGPAEPAATPRAQPGPVSAGPLHPGPTLPDDPAEAVAFVLRQHAQARWRPPPGS